MRIRGFKMTNLALIGKFGNGWIQSIHASSLRVGPARLLRARAVSHKRVLGPQLWPERVGLEEGHAVAVRMQHRHERVVAVRVLVGVLKRAPVHLPRQV